MRVPRSRWPQDGLGKDRSTNTKLLIGGHESTKYIGSIWFQIFLEIYVIDLIFDNFITSVLFVFKPSVINIQ